MRYTTRRTAHQTALLAVLSGTALASLASAQPGETIGADPTTAVPVMPTPDEVAASTEGMSPKAIGKAFQRWMQTEDREVVVETMKTKAASMLSGLDFSALSAVEIQQVLMPLVTTDGAVEGALARLEALQNPATVDGLLATTTKAVISAFAEQERLDDETLALILDHEKLPEALKTGNLLTPFVSISTAQPSALQARAADLAALAAYLPETGVAADQATAAGRYWQVISGVLPGTETETLEAVRTRVAATLRGAKTEGEPAEIVSALKDQIASIDGAFARGELLDHEAPVIDFLWTSETGGPTSLADLRGKVVVIDFWATWCGPCIQSFPAIADLARHYEGYEVVVLGVTTPQGRHHGADGQVVTTGNDRDKEYALMAEFMAAKGVTWPMAFSERAVWTEFGIQGIPHVAIIDAQGVVRHRGIHPMMPKAEKTSLVDGLLAEAGLDTPQS